MNRMGAEAEPPVAVLDAWNAVLDDFEDALDRAVRAATHAGDTSQTIGTSIFTPPASMPPLPAELAERARALLVRNHEVAHEIRGVAARIQPATPSPVTRRPPFAQRPSSSSSFDARA